MINKLIIGVALNSLALYLVTLLMPEVVYTGGIRFIVVGGFIIGLMNTFVKPIMKILSLPVLIATMGLFMVVLNLILFWVSMWLINVIDISGVSVNIERPSTYLLASLIFTFINWVLHIIIHNNKKK